MLQSYLNILVIFVLMFLGYFFSYRHGLAMRLLTPFLKWF